ncbi:hypothetical protein ACFVXQ_00015 [Kitasatospora sp. NPDC058263]
MTQHLLKWEARALYLDIAAGRQTAPGDSTALDELIGMQLVAADPLRPGHYRVLSAHDVAIRLQRHFTALGTQHLSQAAAVPGQMHDLVTAYEAAHPGRGAGALEYVSSKIEMQSRMAPIIASCTVELLTAQPGGPRPPAMLTMSYQRDLGVLGRGARMRTIYDADVRHDAGTARWAATMVEEGAEIRTLPGGTDFARTVIVDGRIAVVATPDPERAVIVRDEALVRYIRLSWLRDWEGALPWDGTAPIEVTAAQRAILRQLAQDVTLEAIAGAAGVSRRAISMRLEPLREAVGVQSMGALLYWWAKNESHYPAEGDPGE